MAKTTANFPNHDPSLIPLIPKKTKIDFNIEEDGVDFGQSHIGNKHTKKTLQQAFEEEAIISENIEGEDGSKNISNRSNNADSSIDEDIILSASGKGG